MHLYILLLLFAIFSGTKGLMLSRGVTATVSRDDIAYLPGHDNYRCSISSGGTPYQIVGSNGYDVWGSNPTYTESRTFNLAGGYGIKNVTPWYRASTIYVTCS
jgi:hypothetical protein